MFCSILISHSVQVPCSIPDIGTINSSSYLSYILNSLTLCTLCKTKDRCASDNANEELEHLSLSLSISHARICLYDIYIITYMYLQI